MTWIAAGLSALLLAALALRHFGSGRAALICTLLFATMPVVWSAVRDASPYLALLPLAVAWLLATTEYLETRPVQWIVAAAVALAAMLYVHAAGVVMAPLYAAITLATLVGYRHSVATKTLFAAGCLVAAAPWLLSTLRDSSPLIAAIKAHGLYDADRFNLLQGGREMTSWLGLTVRSEVYWDWFNPAFLFLGPRRARRERVAAAGLLAAAHRSAGAGVPGVREGPESRRRLDHPGVVCRRSGGSGAARPAAGGRPLAAHCARRRDDRDAAVQPTRLRIVAAGSPLMLFTSATAMHWPVAISRAIRGSVA